MINLINVHSSNYRCNKRITHFYAFIHGIDAFLIFREIPGPH